MTFGNHIERNGNWLRWALVAALFVITVINYVDRQSLSLLAPLLQRQMQISDAAYSHIVSAFLVAYTISYVVAGWVCDRLGSRAGMALFVVWWSLAEMLPPLARTGTQLGGARLLLGLGEAGNYVAAPKAISEWFSAEQRGLALGIYTAGATLGATLAPPLIATMTRDFSWPMVFLATGAAGLIWVIPWLWISKRRPSSQPNVMPVAAVSKATDEHVWRNVLRSRATWMLMSARFLTDPVWYFFLFWFPKYLQQARGLTLAETGHTAWVVYLAADVGTLAGGWVAGPLIRRGMAPLRARRMVMAGAAVLMPLAPLAALLPSLRGALAIAALIALAHMAWLVTLTTIMLDLFPSARVATAAGVIAAGSGLGGMVSAELIGRVIPMHGYTPVFCVMGLLHPLALISIWQLKASATADGVSGSVMLREKVA